MRTLRTTNLYSNELSCPSCIGRIEGRLHALAGVEHASVHTTTGRIEVRYDPEAVSVADLVAAVGEAGYTATPRGF